MKERVFKLYLKETTGERIDFIEGRIIGIIETVSGALDADKKERPSIAGFAKNEDNNLDYKWFKVKCTDDIWERIKGYLLNNKIYIKRITIVRE